MTDDEVRLMLRKECGPNQRIWAQAHGVVPSYVSDVLNGRRDPSPAILAALGLKRVVSYDELPVKSRRKPKAGETGK